MQGEDVQRIRQATERLTQAAGRLHETAGPSSTGADAQSQSGEGGPDVVDADFEEVDKRDRKAG
jgi:hypothetical protein